MFCIVLFRSHEVQYSAAPVPFRKTWLIVPNKTSHQLVTRPNDSDSQPAGVALPTMACVLDMSSCTVPDVWTDSDLIVQNRDLIATLNKACLSQ